MIIYCKDPNIAGDTKKNKLYHGNIEQQQGNMRQFFMNYMETLKCKNLIKIFM